MSHFEFILVGELTSEYEEKTKEILSRLDNGTAFYLFQKYSDETLEGEKKQRTITLTSQWNCWRHLFELVKGCNLQIYGYHKQRII